MLHSGRLLAASCPGLAAQQLHSLPPHLHSYHCSPTPAATPVRLCAVSNTRPMCELRRHGIHPPCMQASSFVPGRYGSVVWPWAACSCACLRQQQLTTPGQPVIHLSGRACTQPSAAAAAGSCTSIKGSGGSGTQATARPSGLQCAAEASCEAWVWGGAGRCCGWQGRDRVGLVLCWLWALVSHASAVRNTECWLAPVGACVVRSFQAIMPATSTLAVVQVLPAAMHIV